MFINRSKKTNFRSLSLSFRKTGWVAVRSLILAGLCFEIIYPFFTKLMQAFMSTGDLTNPTVKLYPLEWNIGRITETISLIKYPASFVNSLIISLLMAALQLMICPLIGYGFARFRFKGRNLLFAMVIITLVIPAQLYSTSTFLYFKFFGPTEASLIGTIWPFVILAFTGMGMKNGLFIFLMRQFFRSLPKELEDAAYIDGSGIFGTYLRVILPNARNMLISIFVLSFSWQWTDYFNSSVFLGINKFVTLPLALINNIQEIKTGGTFIGPIVYAVQRNTASLLIMLPLLIMFGFFQKKIISGIERSGIVE